MAQGPHFFEESAWITERPNPLPVQALLFGKRVSEAAELLPRIFNLCRVAQGLAIRLALGLPVSSADREHLQDEIRREHALRLGTLLPRALGVPGPGPQDMHAAAAAMPVRPAEFGDWLHGDAPLARLLSVLAARFPQGIAVAPILPTPELESIQSNAALENSVAARHMSHPLMQHLEATAGRGPLWRVVARILDMTRPLPPATTPEPGLAVVPAARGLYAVRAASALGRITHFERFTPTDHLLAPDGVWDRAFATLPGGRTADAELLQTVLDPCLPLTVREAAHA